MASVAARSIFRSCSSGRSAFRVASEAKSARSPFRMASNKPPSPSQSTLRINDAVPHGHIFCAHDFHAFHFKPHQSLAFGRPRADYLKIRKQRWDDSDFL